MGDIRPIRITDWKDMNSSESPKLFAGKSFDSVVFGNGALSKSDIGAGEEITTVGEFGFCIGDDDWLNYRLSQNMFVFNVDDKGSLSIKFKKVDSSYTNETIDTYEGPISTSNWTEGDPVKVFNLCQKDGTVLPIDEVKLADFLVELCQNGNPDLKAMAMRVIAEHMEKIGTDQSKVSKFTNIYTQDRITEAKSSLTEYRSKLKSDTEDKLTEDQRLRKTQDEFIKSLMSHNVSLKGKELTRSEMNLRFIMASELLGQTISLTNKSGKFQLNQESLKRSLMTVFKAYKLDASGTTVGSKLGSSTTDEAILAEIGIELEDFTKILEAFVTDLNDSISGIGNRDEVLKQISRKLREVQESSLKELLEGIDSARESLGDDSITQSYFNKIQGVTRNLVRKFTGLAADDPKLDTLMTSIMRFGNTTSRDFAVAEDADAIIRLAAFKDMPADSIDLNEDAVNKNQAALKAIFHANPSLVAEGAKLHFSYDDATKALTLTIAKREDNGEVKFSRARVSFETKDAKQTLKVEELKTPVDEYSKLNTPGYSPARSSQDAQVAALATFFAKDDLHTEQRDQAIAFIKTHLASLDPVKDLAKIKSLIEGPYKDPSLADLRLGAYKAMLGKFATVDVASPTKLSTSLTQLIKVFDNFSFAEGFDKAKYLGNKDSALIKAIVDLASKSNLLADDEKNAFITSLTNLLEGKSTPLLTTDTKLVSGIIKLLNGAPVASPSAVPVATPVTTTDASFAAYETEKSKNKDVLAPLQSLLNEIELRGRADDRAQLAGLRAKLAHLQLKPREISELADILQGYLNASNKDKSLQAAVDFVNAANKKSTESSPIPLINLAALRVDSDEYKSAEKYNAVIAELNTLMTAADIADLPGLNLSSAEIAAFDPNRPGFAKATEKKIQYLSEQIVAAIRANNGATDANTSLDAILTKDGTQAEPSSLIYNLLAKHGVRVETPEGDTLIRKLFESVNYDLAARADKRPTINEARKQTVKYSSIRDVATQTDTVSMRYENKAALLNLTKYPRNPVAKRTLKARYISHFENPQGTAAPRYADFPDSQRQIALARMLMMERSPTEAIMMRDNLDDIVDGVYELVTAKHPSFNPQSRFGKYFYMNDEQGRLLTRKVYKPVEAGAFKQAVLEGIKIPEGGVDPEYFASEIEGLDRVVQLYTQLSGKSTEEAHTYIRSHLHIAEKQENGETVRKVVEINASLGEDLFRRVNEQVANYNQYGAPESGASESARNSYAKASEMMTYLGSISPDILKEDAQASNGGAIPISKAQLRETIAAFLANSNAYADEAKTNQQVLAYAQQDSSSIYDFSDKVKYAKSLAPRLHIPRHEHFPEFMSQYWLPFKKHWNTNPQGQRNYVPKDLWQMINVPLYDVTSEVQEDGDVYQRIDYWPGVPVGDRTATAYPPARTADPQYSSNYSSFYRNQGSRRDPRRANPF